MSQPLIQTGPGDCGEPRSFYDGSDDRLDSIIEELLSLDHAVVSDTEHTVLELDIEEIAEAVSEACQTVVNDVIIALLKASFLDSRRMVADAENQLHDKLRELRDGAEKIMRAKCEILASKEI